jgi:hypothetical protein
VNMRAYTETLRRERGAAGGDIAALRLSGRHGTMHAVKRGVARCARIVERGHRPSGEARPVTLLPPAPVEQTG